MGTGQVTCAVCGKEFHKLWQHLSKQRNDPAHAAFQQTLREQVQQQFDTLLTAVEVGNPWGIDHNTVSSIWRETFGSTATSQRRSRIRRKVKPPCPQCGKPLGKWAGRYCSPACANLASSVDPESKAKRAAALIGRPVSLETRSRISTILRDQAVRGVLAAQRPEVRQQQSAIKKGRYPLHLAVDMASRTPEERRETGQRMLRRVRVIYGVTHPYFIPGVAAKANAAKSKAMSQRIAAGVPTNDWGRYRRGWYESSTSGRQWYQSGWELQFMKVLDAAGVSWTKNHHLRIPYINTLGAPRFYVPDFRVEGGSKVTLIEIKGYHSPNVVLKHQAAEVWCQDQGWSFQVLSSEVEISGWSPRLAGG